MERINVYNMSYDELDKMYFHITNRKNENDINNQGLNPRVGNNSKGILGSEKNPKVFFTKGVTGTLEYITGTFNIAANLLKNNDLYEDKDIPLDYIPYLPNREEYMNMSVEERVMYFCKNYFNNSMYLNLNLEEGKDFQLECEDEKSGKVVMQDRSNMRTSPNVGIANNKISRVLVNENSNVDEFINFLSEKYLSKFKTKVLPIKSKFDKDYLSEYLKRYREKNIFITELQDMRYNDDIGKIEIKSNKENDYEKER